MPPELIRVTDSVTCIRRPSYFTCSYLIHRRGRATLVDAGMKSDGSDVLYALDKLGLAPEQIDEILVTHWHNDHAAGAAALKERSSARVSCGASEAPYLERATASRGLSGWISEATPEAGPLVLIKGLLGSAPMRAVKPDVLLQDGDRVGTFRAIATPGHTDGHFAFFDEEEHILFAGDALAFIDGRLRFMSRPVTPDQVAARASMRRCAELPFELVCAGHRHPGRVEPAVLADFKRRLDDASWPLFG